MHPILDAPEGRRDEFVEPYFRKAKPDQVVAILKGREPARIMTAIGNKKENRWHLANGATLGHSVQLLRQRRALGTDVRAHVPVPSILRARLSESAPLAGQPHARGRYRLSARHQRLSEMRQLQSSAGTRRLAHRAGSADLRSKVAGRLHTLLHRKRTRRCRLPAPAVLLAGRVLRQSVPWNRFAVMCPRRICDGGNSTLGLARRSPWVRAHIAQQCAYSDDSQDRSASSSRQTGLGLGGSFSDGGGSQRRRAASFARTVISAYRLVVSRLTWPSQPRITLTSTPASRRLTAHECRNTCGLM